MPTTTDSHPSHDGTVDLVQVRPFLLKPTFAERIWGKTSLAPWYETTGTDKPVGEAWLTGPSCVVDGGPQAGKTLKQIVHETAGLLGDDVFPLLVKMLFPCEKLSVQVHPDDAQAQAMGLTQGKTECWYVLEAEPGATVACGLKPGVGITDLEQAVADGSLELLLEWLPVEVGDMIFVDAGTVHAIGPGVTLLEVQQTCDITYRLYDYGRPRELHLKEGLAVVKTKTKAGKVKPSSNGGYTRLIDEKYFVVDLFEIEPGVTFEMPMDGLGCVVGLKGQAAVNEVRFGPGQAIVSPVGSVSVSSLDGATIARCWMPKK
jgi:mannose-6-phosphate isomerase